MLKRPTGTGLYQGNTSGDSNPRGAFSFLFSVGYMRGLAGSPTAMLPEGGEQYGGAIRNSIRQNTDKIPAQYRHNTDVVPDTIPT